MLHNVYCLVLLLFVYVICRAEGHCWLIWRALLVIKTKEAAFVWISFVFFSSMHITFKGECASAFHYTISGLSWWLLCDGKFVGTATFFCSHPGTSVLHVRCGLHMLFAPISWVMLLHYPMSAARCFRLAILFTISLWIYNVSCPVFHACNTVYHLCVFIMSAVQCLMFAVLFTFSLCICNVSYPVSHACNTIYHLFVHLKHQLLSVLCLQYCLPSLSALTF